MFSVELSRVRQQDSEQALAHALPNNWRNDLSGSLIVVVDDEIAILDATRTLLETWGCQVITAASGKEALERVASSSRVPDVLICDYRLRSHEDGIQVIESLRAEFNEEIPAMLITGDTGPEKIRQIESSGLKVLHKPLREDQLRVSLAQLAALSPHINESGKRQAEPPRDQHRLGAVGNV